MDASLLALGPLQVTVNGTPLSIRPAQRRVLAVLTLRRPNWVETQSLISHLWVDPPTNARTSLQVHISGIRKLAPELVLTDGSRYRLNPDVTIDIDLYDKLNLKAQGHARDGETAEALALSSKAILMWSGDPLADLIDLPLAVAEIVRLEEVQLGLERIRANSLIKLGDAPAAIADLQTLALQYPLNEAVRHLLMTALYNAGRQTDALRAYQDLRAVLAEQLGIEPERPLRDLEERILLQEPSLRVTPATTPRHNLPSSVTSYVDDQKEMSDLANLMLASPLVTLTGGPGVGKTRLATEIARGLLDEFPNGVWFVALAGAHTQQDVTSAIRAATGVQEPAPDLPSLGLALSAQRMLLIIDNCEHVLEDVAVFATAVLEAGGPLRLLLTSRSPLGVAGEQAWEVAPLLLPEKSVHPTTPAEVLANPAARLFLDRASSVDRTFKLTEASAPPIAALTRRLGGIPLTIELAAKWVPTIGLDQISAMLDQGLDSPTTSLRTTIDRSLALLPTEDAELVHRAAVFNGPFNLYDAFAVCGGTDQFRFAGSMARAVNASLIQTIRAPGAELRYRMLVPIREFLRFEPTGDQSADEQRFIHHYLAKAAAWQKDQFTAVNNLDEIDGDIDNLRAAFTLGLSAKMGDVLAPPLVPLCTYLNQRYLTRESVEWIRQVLDQDLTPLNRAGTLRALGSASEMLGELDQAEEALTEAVTIHGRRRDPESRARCELSLAGVQSHKGAWKTAFATATHAQKYLSGAGNRPAAAIAGFYLGQSLAYGGNVPAGIEHMLETATAFETADQPGRSVQTLAMLATVAALDGNEPVSTNALERAEALASADQGNYRTAKLFSAQALHQALFGNPSQAVSILLENHKLIAPNHPDQRLHLLLPAAVTLSALGDEETTLTIATGVAAFYADSQEALPTPWQRVIDPWITTDEPRSIRALVEATHQALEQTT